jgi:hypothetical protein
MHSLSAVDAAGAVAVGVGVAVAVEAVVPHLVVVAEEEEAAVRLAAVAAVGAAPLAAVVAAEACAHSVEEEVAAAAPRSHLRVAPHSAAEAVEAVGEPSAAAIPVAQTRDRSAAVGAVVRPSAVLSPPRIDLP